MPVYDRVRAAAWLPASPDASLTAHYRALPFPEQWRDVMLDLCNTGRSEDLEPYRTVPTHRMDQVLQTLAPDHLVLGRPFSGQGGAGHWILVPEGTAALPEPAFRALRDAWLSDLRPDMAGSLEYRELLSRARSLLDEAPPSWRPVELELLRCPVTEGGTAAPLDHQYPLTTDWIARRVLALEPYDFDGGRLRFHAVPRGPRDQGAELVSEPLPFEARGRTWWYSIRLNITLHTVPFERLPRIHLHAGIRRWATKVSATTERLHLPPSRKTTVLLRPRVPWLRGAPVSDRFAVARLERRWDRKAGAWTTGWADGGPTGILRRISLAEPFPDAEEVLTSPEKWLIDDMRAAVVHSTAMGGHGVGTGLMSDQRSKIVTWAEAAIPAELRPVPERVRTSLGSSAPSVPKRASRAQRVRKATAYAMTCLNAPGADGSPLLEARLLWQTPEMRDAAIDALSDHLGLVDGNRPDGAEFRDAVPGAPAVLEWRTVELTVRLRCMKLTGGLGADLPIPGGARSTKAAVTAAITARRDEATAFLAADRPGPIPSIALVELDRAADFRTADHDPKFALRLGFAEAGVLTQFLAVPKKVKGYNSLGNAEHRALMAWDDGLRQLGARVHTRSGPGTGVPAGMRFAAIWMVRKNRRSRTRWAGHIPIAVLMTPGPEEGTARVQGWDAAADSGAGDWISYPAMLLRLTQHVDVSSVVSGGEEEDGPAGRRPSRRRNKEEQRRATGEWLQKVQRSLRGAPTMLLADAQNARSFWPWLQDGTVEADRIRTGHAPARRLDPDLRLVRVRTGQGRETPQWWGVNREDGPNGIPSHLWVPQQGGRVFWSTTPKPVQFQSSAVVADKLGGRRLTQGPRAGELTVDTDKPAWNPSLVELAVLGCHEADGDVPEALALVVHHLRQPADYPEALSLPLPLHLAGLAQQYVLPLPPEGSGS
ncbi:pPIWI_RE module domain-containing protein [Actinomadura bangladeshensis]|uniref:DUF3893 domain-containing protein n=1 Tax=Actinomadura bangladeshensis TaxID=453573 RepID=A0A4R4NZT8_9ACTN|nr:DUF3962 domain-containing protein [Actinomadura bangladeshensis]TDC13810.1 DUF3893 domain-containing protein [Actinomadura bangladeshensis]